MVGEVAVMRVMVALQALLRQAPVARADVAALRAMCDDLAVDVSAMLDDAEALGGALGPEAKKFVAALRALFQDADAP